MSLTDLRVHLLDQALKLALSLADDMTRAETLEGLAVAYAEAGQTARAATIFQRIWQIARHQSNASDRQWQLYCAAEACVEANLEELAVAIAADLVRASDRASVAVDLAQHHVNAGRLSPATTYLAEALTWVRRAEEAGEGTSLTRRATAETAVDLGLIEHAVQVASALDHHP
jgi:isopropylmalate/homocitrate/citramalate synthase